MAQAQDTATRLGSSLGPYRLEELLGRTETGDIYRAKERANGTLWLVKLVHAELCAMPGFRAALRQQGMFLSALEHPRIAGVARIDEDGERCFIAMEWHPDGTLRSLLGKRGGLGEDLPLAIDLAAQIAEGLAFAHEQGFVHGSLSPEDMLLARRDGGGYSLKISDFGLAWLLLDYSVDPGPWGELADLRPHPGALPRPGGRRPRRPVRPRGHPLRADHRLRALLRPHPGRRRRRPRLQRAGAPPRPPPRPAPRPGGDHPALPRQVPRRPLCRHRRSGPGPARAPGGGGRGAWGRGGGGSWNCMGERCRYCHALPLARLRARGAGGEGLR